MRRAASPRPSVPAIHRNCTPATRSAAGDGLCVPDAVRALTEEGPRYVRELIDWGAAFDRAPDGQPALGREAAHSVRRVLHAHDATGREIGRVLWEKVAAHPRVTVYDDALVMSLVDPQTGNAPGRRSSAATAPAADRRTAHADRHRAAPGRCSGKPRTRRSRPATASRWRSTPAHVWRTSSSCSSIPPCSASKERRDSCSLRRCAAKARAWSTRPANRS